jgi:arylsulfatase A-like enzyme
MNAFSDFSIGKLVSIRLVLFMLAVCLSWQLCAVENKSRSTETKLIRPNIVLLLADDLGFSDIAPYGSEINTPQLTSMAKNGVKFTNYHTAANCAPARAMLLTGVDSHRAGVPNIPEMIPAAQRYANNYQGVLSKDAVTVASLLQTAGYDTYMAGKWHLGQTSDLLPSKRGFQRTLALGDSGADNWEQKPYIPIYDKANWYADGEEYQLPEDFYSSRFLIDKTIEFIDSNSGNGKPFFAYVPFQAVHIPVQAPQAFIDNYMGTYDQGWHELRQARLARAITMGLVADTTQVLPMPTTDQWEDLSDERKRYESKRMAVYAGMIEAMDHHIGRLVNHLKQTGQYDNTLFIFTSDNGSEPSGPADPDRFINNLVMGRQGYSTDYDSLGLKGSYNSISPSFASASASPLAYFKFYVGEGGLRVPMIMAGSGIVDKGQKSDAFIHVTDITPTILKQAGIEKPSTYFGGRKIEPISGRDISLLLNNTKAEVRGEQDHDAVGYELAGNAALFLGDFKIVRHVASPGDGQWRLFNIKKDPGETSDLSKSEPKRLHRMLNLYQQYEIDNRVLPIPANYDRMRQAVVNGIQDRLAIPLLSIILLLFTVIPFYTFYRSGKNRIKNN